MKAIYKMFSRTKPSRFYVGSASCFRARKNSHLCQLKKGSHHNPILQRHANKYGTDDLVFEVLEEVVDASLLLVREQFYIDELRPPLNLAKRAGNTLGTKRSAATRRLISLLKQGNCHNLGCHLTPEHKANIQMANKGKPKTEEHKQKLRIAALNRDEKTRDKYRQAQLGKRLTEATKKKIGLALTGERNPRWK